MQKTKLEKFIQNSTAPFSQKSHLASLSSTSKLYDERKKLMQQNKSDAASKNRVESNNSVTRLSMPKESKSTQPHQRQRSSNNFSKLNSIQSRSFINGTNNGNSRPKSGQFRKERSFTPVKSRYVDNNYYNQNDQFENDIEEDATGVQVLQTKESVEMRTAYQSNPQSSKKRDMMEQFIEPENLVGLKGIKNEIINKQQEKEELEMNIKFLQDQLKEVSKKYDGLDKGNTLVHKEFKKLTTVNDSQIEQQKIAIANLQQHVKEQKALIQLEVVRIPQSVIFQKQREEIRGQVLLQRKQIDVAKKKVDIQKQKYKDFKIGTNQSIMNMSAMISTTSKTSNNSKFLTQNRGFIQSNSNK
ncbi:UNKNOWN [Stylonychia lemnae]|uniref:Uncharacterized protein n=1 Tax=Stylonychia lemnae TaxID=5949 RepID=A0A078AHS2_STYLE|nr:UNKNOWN [Stylonychia lemnae]|eukprot:CDW81799.1 UNKNOWN [Stylonychia lemnae]